jgi:iron complex outermembrane receptor protein
MIRNSLTRGLLCGAALAVLAAPVTTFAQEKTKTTEKPATTEKDKDNKSLVEEVIVVGTNISGVKPVGSEAVVIGRDEALKMGVSNVADVVRRLPQIQMSVGDNVGFQGGTAHQGYNGSQTETLNLRGLGSAATLILVDGRRPIGSGAVSTMTEANQVPLAALERVEVLPDGASALYGSDAVAGVINFVLRKNFSGLEVSGRVGNQSGGTEYDASIVGGKGWDGLGGLGAGSLIVTYEHQDRDAYSSGKIDRLRRDLRSQGGPDLRIDKDSASVGFSPNIISQGNTLNPTIPGAVNFTYWGVPAGNGVGLTAGSLALNNPNLSDNADYTDYTGKQVRDQVAVHFKQELTDRIDLFADGTYTHRDTTSRSAPATTRLSLLGTPFFIPGLPANQQVQYSTLKDGMMRTFSATSQSFGGAVGVRGDLGGDWRGEAYFNYGRNTQCDSCVTGQINPEALAAQVASGAINPLSSTALTPSQIAAVYGSSRFESRSTLKDTLIKFDGPLFSLPAGKVKVAVGGEYRVEESANRNSSTSGVANTTKVLNTYDNSAYERSIKSLFGELYVPLVGEEQSVPWVKSLTASLAARYDDYADAGDTTNPRIGVTWELNDELRFSGSWGTSFRAPTVTDANTNAVTSGTLFPGLPNYDPRITNGVLPAGIFGPFGLTNAALLLGSNADLKPETSENWSVSGRWQHGGFDLTATYWSIAYKNQIVFPGALIYLAATPADVPANGGNYRGWGDYIIPINNPSTCNNANLASADPKLAALIQNLNYDFVSGGGQFSQASSLKNDFCRVNVVLDSRLQNLGSVIKTGYDVSAKYTRNVGGVWVIGQLAVSRQLKNDIKAQAGQAATDVTGDLSQTYGGFKWKGTASVSANWKNFDTTLMARYVSSMKAPGMLDVNFQPLPTKTLSPHTEFDLTLGYNGTLKEPTMGLKSWRAQFAVTNLFDDYPDFFASQIDGAWNPKYGLPLGRTYSFQLTGRF